MDPAANQVKKLSGEGSRQVCLLLKRNDVSSRVTGRQCVSASGVSAVSDAVFSRESLDGPAGIAAIEDYYLGAGWTVQERFPDPVILQAGDVGILGNSVRKHQAQPRARQKDAMPDEVNQQHLIGTAG
jgi:hypothetical protein